MNKFSRLTLVAALLVAFLGMTSACRTKTRKNTRPTVTPTTTDSVGEVGMPATTTTPTTKVEDPADFVDDTPRVTSDNVDLGGDIDTLNRSAQEKGWIRDAFFEYDAVTLSADAQDALTATATWLKAHPEFALMLEGHCDERGTEQYNLALGDRRANTAREFLITLGVSDDRLRTVSYGEERPFGTGGSESDHARNRRAHLVLVRK